MQSFIDGLVDIAISGPFRSTAARRSRMNLGRQGVYRHNAKEERPSYLAVGDPKKRLVDEAALLHAKAKELLPPVIAGEASGAELGIKLELWFPKVGVVLKSDTSSSVPPKVGRSMDLTIDEATVFEKQAGVIQYCCVGDREGSSVDLCGLPSPKDRRIEGQLIFDLLPETSVMELKGLIEHRLGIPAARQLLSAEVAGEFFLEGHTSYLIDLEDASTMQEHGIDRFGHIIHFRINRFDENGDFDFEHATFLDEGLHLGPR
ncbi:unnamed protein product [Effrenium voratum]|nr:unnamed protein product [Effrenium voratum]